MRKQILSIIILLVAFILLTTCIILLYTGNPTISTKVPDQKKDASEELIDKLRKQLKIEGYTLKYIKHEGNIYYFNQVDKDGKVGYEITYDENTEQLATIDKNTVSEGYEEIK